MRWLFGLALLIGACYGQCPTHVLQPGTLTPVDAVQIDSIPCLPACEIAQFHSGGWFDIPDTAGYFMAEFDDTTAVRVQLFIDCHLIAWDSCFVIYGNAAPGVILYSFYLIREFPQGSSVRMVTDADSFIVEFKPTLAHAPVSPFMDTDTLCPPVWADAPAPVYEVWIDLNGHAYTRPPVGQLVYGLHSKRKIFAQ